MRRAGVLSGVLLFAISVFAADQVRTRTRVNLRKTDGMTAQIIRTLPEGEPLHVARRSGVWLEVTTSSGETGWVNENYVLPVPVPPIVDRRVKCEVRKTRETLFGEDLYIIQAFAAGNGRMPTAVSERFVVSAFNVAGSSGPDAEAYQRFLEFVRSQSGQPCGAGNDRDPYASVPKVDVIEAPDVVARVGKCKIHQSTRSSHGFDEYVYQASIRSPVGVETAASYRYAVSAENVVGGDAPLVGDVSALVEHVKSELNLTEQCRSRAYP